METTDEQEEAKKIAQEKEKTRREKLAGYFYDLSKLCFTGMVIGLIVPLFSGEAKGVLWAVAAFGLCATILSAFVANKLLK